MQAVIMAGGKGTRLASVTRDIPKPMVALEGRPLLVHQVENLRQCSITDIIVVVGHLGEVIRDYFGNGSAYGVHIRYYTETTPLGTAAALRYLVDMLADDFILVFGDLFINVDFARFYRWHQAQGAAATLFVHPNAHPYDSDIVITDAAARVVAWSKKNTERQTSYRNLVNAGLYVLSRDLLAQLPPEGKADLERDLIIPAIAAGGVYAYNSSEYVHDIGTPERLQSVEQDVARGIPQARNLQQPQRAIFLDRDGTLNRYVGYLRRPEELTLEPQAAAAVRRINGSPYLAIVVTNQPVVARGEVTREGLAAIHAELETQLGREGAYINGLYYCPHHPDGGFPGEVPELKGTCHCRKPDIGLLEQAARDYHIDLAASWIVGDTAVDVRTGHNGGLHTALVATGDPDKFRQYDDRPDLQGTDLLDAVEQILQRKE